MRKVRKIRIFWLVLAVCTAVSGVAAVAGIFFFANRSLWVPLGVCAALTLHALYGVTCYFLAFARASDDLALCRAVEEGITDLPTLSVRIRVTPAALPAVVARCIGRGYLPGGELRGDRLFFADGAEKAPSAPRIRSE